MGQPNLGLFQKSLLPDFPVVLAPWLAQMIDVVWAKREDGQKDEFQKIIATGGSAGRFAGLGSVVRRFSAGP